MTEPVLGARYVLTGRAEVPPEGSTWRATDRLRDEPVLVRVLPVGPWPEALGALFGGGHPAYPRLLATSSLDDGRPVLIYEEIEGTPLGAEGAPVGNLRTWARRAAQLLEAVEYAHGLGWVHGDLRPASVCWSAARDRVFVLDAGAMLRANPPRTESSYLAPEEPEAPTVQSDLFAVGVLLATLATGQLPFSGARGLGPEETLDVPFPPDVRRWLEAMLRADPAARPCTATEALSALEASTGRSLRRTGSLLARMTSVGPIARQELVGRLAGGAAAGGVGIVLGDADSGRSTVLRAIHQRLRRAGRRSEIIELGRDPVRSHLALRSVLADHTPFADEPPPRDLPPAALAAGLRAYEASVLAATIALLEGPAGPLLFDDLDAATLAGRVLIAAMERTASPGTIIATDGGSQRMLEGLVAARGDGRDLPAVLSPLHGEQIVRWLHEGLGPVAQPFALAELVRAETDGLPGLVLSQLGLLLEMGALHRVGADWRWSEHEVLPLLGGVTQPMRAFANPGLTAEERLAHVLSTAERAAAAADPHSALSTLQSELGRPEFEAAEAHVLAPAWDRMAHFAMVLDQPAVAARYLAALRTRAPADDPGRRARLLVEECRALRASGRWRHALSLLEDGWASLQQHGEPDTRREGWATLASCHLKAEALDLAEEAITSLERLSRDATAWLARTATLRANLEIQAKRPHAAAEACARALEQLGDDGGSQRGVLAATRATALRALGRSDEAIAGFAAAKQLFLAEDRLLEAARVANKLGRARHEAGDWEGAATDWFEFLALARRADDAWEQCCALNNLGDLYRDTGNLDRSAEALEEALRLARRHKLGRLEPLSMGNLAHSWARMGDTALAADAMQEAIDLASRHGWWQEAATATRRLTVLRLDQGELGAARALLERVRRVSGQLDDPGLDHLLDALEGLLGLLGEGSQEGDESRALEAIRALSAAGDEVNAARVRVRLAEALVGTSRYGPAETLLDEAEQVLRPLNARPDLARIEEARRHLVSATRTSLQRLTRHHDWLQELTLALSRERDLDRLVELVLDRALRLVDEERGLVRLFDERGVPSLQVRRRVEARDTGTHPTIREEDSQESPAAELTATVLARVVRTSEPLVVPDLRADPELAMIAQAIGGPPRGVICVPILRASELLGVIYVDGPSLMGPGSEVKAELLVACADAASVAVENARLIEALKRKQDALAIMAHELRTPITSIIGFASLLLSPDEDRSVQEDGEMILLIKSEAERVRGMVGRVLELARMQAADAEWRRDPVDPLGLVVAGVDSLRPLARQSEVQLSATAEEDLPDLLGDEERLIQVMVNLVGNALKFVPLGGHVEVAARAEDGGVVITVEDDGPGIPAERLGRIFDPWQQAGSVRMRRKGVGLGLAITQAIVQRHGGWIRAENRDEGGARFTVWLPAAQVDSSLGG